MSRITRCAINSGNLQAWYPQPPFSPIFVARQRASSSTMTSLWTDIFSVKFLPDAPQWSHLFIDNDLHSSIQMLQAAQDLRHCFFQDEEVPSAYLRITGLAAEREKADLYAALLQQLNGFRQASPIIILQPTCYYNKGFSLLVKRSCPSWHNSSSFFTVLIQLISFLKIWLA